MIALAKKIRYILFVNLRAVSYRVLRLLNPEYQGAMVVAHAHLAIDEGRNETMSTTGVGIKRAVLLNSDKSDMNAEMLLFTMRGMNFVDTEIEYILSNLVPIGPELTVDELNTKLDAALQRAQAHEATSLHIELYAKFLAHKREVIENKRAYLPAGRANPNAVFWPDPSETGNSRSLYTELPVAKRTPIVDKNSKIVSAGSCFATEIAHYLIGNGYNYLVTEDSGGREAKYEILDMEGKINASAAWGIIFNTPSFRQLVEKAFGQRELPRIVWSQTHKGENLFFDPFRENVAFRSIADYEENYSLHVAAARRAFEQMDVFILTLGLNEVWSFPADGSVFSRSPWRAAPSLIRRNILTVEENVQDLLKMADILRRFNPKVKIICTVSPVPLHATFRADDHHVIAANTHSKAVLRVAAEEFVNLCPEVYYFPSYEIVTVSTENPWAPDQRHVSRAAVDKVMSAFVDMFVK
jgi:GSCFA family